MSVYSGKDLAAALEKGGLGHVFANALADGGTLSSLGKNDIKRGMEALQAHIEKSLKSFEEEVAEKAKGAEEEDKKGGDHGQERVTLYVLGEMSASGGKLVRQGCRWCQLTATSLVELNVPHDTVLIDSKNKPKSFLEM